MNLRLLQRHLSTVQTIAPGQYTTETMDGAIAVACPECGHTSELEQVPRASGEVPQPWQCPYVCAWEGRLQLENWAEPVLT